jgi:predicted phage terminase large subunit-like protein
VTYASAIEIPGAPGEPTIDTGNDFTSVKQNFGAHHLYWLNCLQQVADGKIKRLLGMMPPGSAKSTYTSVVWPTYFLGRNPKTSIILASYGSDLPRKFGRRARSIIQQPIFKRIFDCELSEESSAVDEWALTNGSEWMAAGILTGITGNRADGIIWDDLIKGREQADSDVIRNKTWDEYINSLLTRKKPNAWEVGITTRWHEDDPAGRILPADYDGRSGWVECQDGNNWYVVCLPYDCERVDDPLGRNISDPLWPEWFNEDLVSPMRRQPRTWSALYQQRPAPDSGDFFKDEWFKPYGPQMAIRPPDRRSLHIYGASDYAVSAEKNDYTVHIVVGVDPDNRIFLLDLWRKQASSDEWVESLCDLIEYWKPLGWAEEKGQINAGVGPFLDKRLRERGLYIARAQFPSRVEKAIRAQAIRGRMAMDGLHVPIAKSWYPEFRRELLSFPAARHDDQADALGLIGQVLDKMVAGRRPSRTDMKKRILSTDPTKCTVTLTDLFEDNERRMKRSAHRIH